MTRGGWHRLPALAIVAVLLATLTAACGGDETDLPERVEQEGPPPTPALDPKEQQILIVYEDFVHARAEALHMNDPDHPELTTYAGGAALRSVREEIDTNNNLGARYDGSVVVVWAEVVPGDAEMPVPEGFADFATVESCLDVSEFIPVKIEDESSLLREDAERGSYLSRAIIAHDADDDQWIVVSTTFDWETPC